MPFKMIANRSVYLSNEGREYAKGESFTVATEAEKNRLVRTKRASLDAAKVAPKPAAARPELKTRAMMAEQPAPVRPAARDPEEASGGITFTADNNAPSGEINANKPNRYRRSDMRSED